LILLHVAGSERLAKSLSGGQRLKEAMMINRTLSALGNVVRAINGHSNFVPYRDSKLTRLLQDSVGGNSYTTLIAAMHPLGRRPHVHIW